MKLSFFGKEIFDFSKSKSIADRLFTDSQSHLQESKVLPDFFSRFGSSNELAFSSLDEITEDLELKALNPKGKKKKATKKKEKKKHTPKEVYELKLLRDESFKINMGEKYVDEQIEEFKEKLSLINDAEYDMNNGVKEVSSILIRMENRKKYAEDKDAKDTFELYPYTSTIKINDVLVKHSHLKMGQIAQFIADLPKDATKAMRNYNKAVKTLCGKKAVFYIIADQKDFEKTLNRRDPILLVQSPFGHFWQILGAWGEEDMKLLAEL